MNLQRKIFLSCCLVTFSMIISAQSIIRGTVTDGGDGSPIIGATVTEYDKDKRIITGTITDPNGNYNLRVKNLDGIIIISYIGYASHEFTIGGREVINIELNPSAIQMEEVVRFVKVIPVSQIGTHWKK